MIKIRVVIDSRLCSGCGYCIDECAFETLTLDPLTGKAIVARPDLCTGCAMCVDICDKNAIKLVTEMANSPAT